MKWWLSYASETEFLGVVIAEIDDSWAGQTFYAGERVVEDTDGFLHACRMAKKLGVSPGGEVRGYRIPDEPPADRGETEFREKLLAMEPWKLFTKDELLALGVAVSTKEH